MNGCSLLLFLFYWSHTHTHTHGYSICMLGHTHQNNMLAHKMKTIIRWWYPSVQINTCSCTHAHIHTHSAVCVVSNHTLMHSMWENELKIYKEGTTIMFLSTAHSHTHKLHCTAIKNSLAKVIFSTSVTQTPELADKRIYTLIIIFIHYTDTQACIGH